MNGPKVGDVLRRKMFAPKQYTRKDAVGLMASSPELVQAVQRRNMGGINIGGMAQQPAALDNGMTAESLMMLAGGRNSPRSTTDTVEENITSSASPASPPKDSGYRTTADAESGRIAPAVSTTASTTATAGAQLKQVSLAQMLTAAQSNKTAAEFLKENKDLLDKNAPLPKGRDAKDYLTKYFLDIAAAGAAGQDIVPALAGQAPKNFEDYLAGKKEEETSEYQRNLLALTMGITDKKAQDASNQALNLKILEIEADQPEKIKQVNALAKQMMDRDPTLTLTEATKLAQDRVFEPTQGKISMLSYQGMKDLGFSDAIAGVLAAPATSDLFTDPTQALGALQRFAGTDVLSQTDIEYLANAAGLDADQVAAVLRGEPVPSRQT